MVKSKKIEQQKIDTKVSNVTGQTLSAILTLTSDKSDNDVAAFIKTFIIKKP